MLESSELLCDVGPVEAKDEDGSGVATVETPLASCFLFCITRSRKPGQALEICTKGKKLYVPCLGDLLNPE